MTARTAAGPAAGTVTRFWKTGVIIAQADLTGILGTDPTAPDLQVLRAQFLESMNALAAAENAPEVTWVRFL